MARAYQKKGSGARRMWCDSCSEWDSIDDWTCHELYLHSEYDGITVTDSDGNYFTSDCSTVDVWSHDECGEYYAYAEPEDGEIWVCGDCNVSHSEKSEAMYCCT